MKGFLVKYSLLEIIGALYIYFYLIIMVIVIGAVTVTTIDKTYTFY